MTDNAIEVEIAVNHPNLDQREAIGSSAVAVREIRADPSIRVNRDTQSELDYSKLQSFF